MATPVWWQAPRFVAVILSKEVLVLILFSMFLIEMTLPVFLFYHHHSNEPQPHGMIPPNRPLDPDLYSWPPVKNSEYRTSTKRKKAVVDEGTNEAVVPKSGWGESKLTALERIGCVILRWKHGDRPKRKLGTRCTGRLIGKNARETAIKYEIARDELVADAATLSQGADAVRVCVNASAVSCDAAMASPLTKLVDLCTFVCGLLAISVPVGVFIDMAVFLAHKLRY